MLCWKLGLYKRWTSSLCWMQTCVIFLLGCVQQILFPSSSWRWRVWIILCLLILLNLLDKHLGRVSNASMWDLLFLQVIRRTTTPTFYSLWLELFISIDLILINISRLLFLWNWHLILIGVESKLKPTTLCVGLCLRSLIVFRWFRDRKVYLP